MPYFPGKLPNVSSSDGQALAGFLEDELQRIASSAIDDVRLLELRDTATSPLRPQTGNIVYADGTNYNPGSGEGLYLRNSTGLWLPIPKMLPSAFTIYVNHSSGNDANLGTLVSPVATIPQAVKLARGYMLNGFSITIDVEDSVAYSDPIVVNQGLTLIFQGNSTTPGNVKTTSTGAHAFLINTGSQVTIHGFKFSTVGAGDCINIATNANVFIDNCEFSTNADFNIQTNSNGVIGIGDNITISANTRAHIHMPSSSMVFMLGPNYNLVGTPHWGDYFVGLRQHACLQSNSVTFTGPATGNKYLNHFGAFLDTDGRDPNSYFPGDVNGSSSDGGFERGLVSRTVWTEDWQLVGIGKGLRWVGLSGAPGVIHGFGAPAANAFLGTSLFQGEMLLRDPGGGIAKVLCDSALGVALLLGQTGANFAVVDPGAGAGKWFVTSAGNVRNRYAAVRGLYYELDGDSPVGV